MGPADVQPGHEHVRHAAFGRWGGDEFLVVCSETGLEDARVLARRIHDEVAGHTFGPAIRVTLSIGTAELRAGEDRDALLHRADLGLYAVKADARAITAPSINSRLGGFTDTLEDRVCVRHRHPSVVG